MVAYVTFLVQAHTLRGQLKREIMKKLSKVDSASKSGFTKKRAALLCEEN
jgi:hypothetical protein